MELGANRSLEHGGHEINAMARACDPGGGAGSTAEVHLEVGHGALGQVVGLRHRVVVELALGRDGHILPSL